MLETRKLSRAYGSTTVVDEVSFDVRPGRMTGFVGANGAGKTTTMQMMVGVLAPSAGDVLWDGSLVTTAQRRRFGYMPEERGLYPRMKIAEQLVYFARLHGFSHRDATRRAQQLLEHFDLDQRKNDELDKLSLGNQQRVQIAAALIHRPDALILDEPFSGLDPIAVDSMVELLSDQAAEVPLLFSSHQLELVERLCDDLVILSAGRVVAAGPVEQLRGRGPDRYRIVLEQADAAWLRDLRGIIVRDVDGATALVDLDGTTGPALLADVMAREPVREFAVVRQPLSELFREAIA